MIIINKAQEKLKRLETQADLPENIPEYEAIQQCKNYNIYVVYFAYIIVAKEPVFFVKSRLSSVR